MGIHIRLNFTGSSVEVPVPCVELRKNVHSNSDVLPAKSALVTPGLI